MPARAKLQVLSGPDRGKWFELSDELVHIGKGTNNQIVLTDASLAEHTASIVTRNGRYAIYTSVAEGIEVEGNSIPPERWVWLPTEASVKLSSRTSFQFLSPEAEAAQEPAAEEPKASTRKTVEVEEKKKPKKNVAKFITDGPGDPLVRLGADGHLPELRLSVVGQSRGEGETGPKKTNPLLLYAAIAGSFLFTILMLFIETENRTDGADKAQALRNIARYYGDEDEEPAPYQLSLRAAKQARLSGNYAREREEYRNVLRLLRAEGQTKSFSGLTGHDDGRSDQDLEKQISILLGE